MAAGEPEWWYKQTARLMWDKSEVAQFRRASDACFHSLFSLMQIPLKRLHPAAQLPKRANTTDAGVDLYALDEPTCDYRVLMPGERRAYRTGISIAVPAGYYARIAPRSGLAAKQGIDVLAGVCDASYRGEILVVLLNTGADPVWLKGGDRIAQLIVERCELVEFTEVDDLEETQRANGGFGSTGS